MRRDLGFGDLELADVMIGRLVNGGMGKQSGSWPRSLLICFLLKSPCHDISVMHGFCNSFIESIYLFIMRYLLYLRPLANCSV